MALLLSVIDEEMARVVCTVVYDNVQYLASLLRVQVVVMKSLRRTAAERT